MTLYMYMYIAPGKGLTKPLGRNFDVNRHIWSLRAFVASLKKISLKSDFMHFFHDFIHVYSTGTGVYSPQGTKFCCKFKNNVFEIWFYTFFHDLLHVYSPGAGTDKPPGDKMLMSTERPYHFIHLLQVSKKSLWSLILYIFSWFNTFI